VAGDLWIPPSAGPVASETAHVVYDNQTDLPDEMVQAAIETHFVEHASMLGIRGEGATFQSYATSTDGSLLARGKFRTPTNVIEEIKLARDLAERDDDVGAVIGAMLAIAFSDGMQNFHKDERNLALFNGVAREANLDMAFKELYREYLIAGQVTTFAPFVREKVEITVGEREETISLAVPMVGVLPAECIRPLGGAFAGEEELAYLPDDPRLRAWLEEFFGARTTAARKAEMRREDPVAAALFVEQIDATKAGVANGHGLFVYRLNRRMARRTTMPKGVWPHPRPPMTRSFALLEAKRLLNIMDFALLQGGSNFIVVAKKGTNERPAMPEEVQNLTEVVRRASRTGVIVGDHRLTFEIITPDLSELLNAEKRTLLGRRLAMSMLRLPEIGLQGKEGAALSVEFIAKVISGDRLDLKRHVERHIYGEAVRRNSELEGRAKVWFPRIMLQGAQWFTDLVLKLRDRGDIPRRFAVEAGGFDWEASVAQRERELAENIDETMAPAAVPFSNPAQGPQDNNDGRPRGSSPDNGRPGARQGPGQDPFQPRRTITRNPGETIRAIEEGEAIRRVGELTYAVLEEYPEAEVGRVTQFERRALEAGEPTREGPTAVVPVNPTYEVAELRAVRLAPGLSILVGERRDGALVAKALSFREPEFDLLKAEETALRWGFAVPGWTPEPEIAERAQLPAPDQPIEVHVHVPGQPLVRRRIIRDESGNPIGTEDVPVEVE
jgi:hypothetical protein